MPLALEEIQQDPLAMSVARAIAVANDKAASLGMNIATALVTISEDASPPNRIWRIHYGPRDYRNRRGGDLVILVSDSSGEIQQVIRGQ